MADVETPQLEVVEIPDVEEAARGTEPLPDALPDPAAAGRPSPIPDTLTPLAVGQERSIKLVNDVLSGNRMLAMVASQGSRERRARARTTSTTSASPGPSPG